ncbi:hypothetical protein A2U01_0010124 [Trifolium medium]|uniref:Uncharacterized protein n=1 Tax=Trifolium medium TaxID=97028 RepID=A0A392MNZ7_9FABA|nr:hypothetical protein [Trifolium medium]
MLGEKPEKAKIQPKKEERAREERGRRIPRGGYPEYTPLNTSREKILQDCLNTKFTDAGIRPLREIRENSRTNKNKFCRYHKRRDPGKRPFVAAITGRLTKPLSSPITDKEKQKETENKGLTTASIMGGPSNPKGRSGGTTKRRIAEMCYVRTDTTTPEKEEGQC